MANMNTTVQLLPCINILQLRPVLSHYIVIILVTLSEATKPNTEALLAFPALFKLTLLTNSRHKTFLKTVKPIFLSRMIDID